MRDLYIIGAGGFGKEVAWLIERINKEAPTWNIKGFIDDNATLHNTILGPYRVLGDCNYLKGLSTELWVVCAIGSPAIRCSVINSLRESLNINFATLIDPCVIVSESVQIGKGSIICAGTALTVNIKIGNHVHINLNSTVGHDVVINDFVTIYPGVNISGNVHVSHNVEIGTGTAIVQGKSIGQNATIGAGAVVIDDITLPGTYVGTPAYRVERQKQ